MRSWDGRRLSRRSDRIVAGLREEPTRWISRFLTLIWVRILAARRVWTPWRLFCGVGRAGVPSGIYQRTGALHCGDGGPLFRSPSRPPFSAQGHGGATSINACFGGAGYFSRSQSNDGCGAHSGRCRGDSCKGAIRPIEAFKDAVCLRPLHVCAVTRRRFPVGASPARRNAPAGSNRSSHGGNKMAEAFGVAGHV